MNILYVLPTVTHPSMRGELRHYYFMKALAARHTVTLLSVAKTKLSKTAEQELRAGTQRLIIVNAAAPTAAPPSSVAGRLASRFAKYRRFKRAFHELGEALRREVRERHYDLVLCYGVDLYPVFKGFQDVPIVFDLCDATSLRLKNRLRFTNLLELPWRIYRYFQVRTWERRVCHLTPDVLFISRRDRHGVAGCPESAAVIPNGVDASYWTARTPRTPSTSIVFTGVMDYPPNVDAARYLIRELAPRLHREVPDCEIVIAGRNPSGAIIRDADQTARVVITGGVDDLRPYLDRAAVFVAPLRYASGTQNKSLEARAMSLPVVTTPVAAEGLRVTDEDEPPVRIANDAKALATAVVTLLRDRRAQQELGAQGRAFVERHFNWDTSADLLERFCQRASARATGVRGRAPSPRTAVTPAKESIGAVDPVA